VPISAPDDPAQDLTRRGAGAEAVPDAGAGPDADAEAGPGYPRRVSDAASIRALAHPVRLGLLEALAVAGPLTATGASEIIGESPTTCSFHLRQLARYGYVEEAGGGKGRQRPWRLVGLATQISAGEADQEAGLAAAALRELARQRAMDRLSEWDRERQRWPRRWRRLSQENYSVMFVTADELKAFKEDLNALLCRYDTRTANPATRPAGSVPVETLAFIHPVGDPPEADRETATADGGR
jgi:DNA-binding transcriptional ArsR family regulator